MALSLNRIWLFCSFTVISIGSSWSVKKRLNSFKVRAGFNRATRAPNVRELFAPQGFGLGGSIDICANDPATGVPSATLEQCMRTGVSEAQYGNIIANPASQYNTLLGGNPDLYPEVADTITVGLVITPKSVPGQR